MWVRLWYLWSCGLCKTRNSNSKKCKAILLMKYATFRLIWPQEKFNIVSGTENLAPKSTLFSEGWELRTHALYFGVPHKIKHNLAVSLQLLEYTIWQMTIRVVPVNLWNRGIARSYDRRIVSWKVTMERELGEGKKLKPLMHGQYITVKIPPISKHRNNTDQLSLK